MIRVVGYEGCRRPHHACSYASAAVMTEDGSLYNSPIPNMARKDGAEALAHYVSSGVITLLETPIEIPDNQDPMFVFDMPVEYIDREPYRMGQYKDGFLDGIVFGWLAQSRGTTRGYHLFKSMEGLKKWLVSLHIGNNFVMTPYEAPKQ
jgi:hypothetical protein